uniref:Uncharacterized protein n=1 Tax=Nothobranchius furzeri TaxID=105023 RepID=A0A8C6PKY8_NOTFU
IPTIALLLLQLHYVLSNSLPAAILDDPMECSRGERLAITLAKNNINRSSNRSTTGKLEVDIFELLRDSEYEMGDTSEGSKRDVTSQRFSDLTGNLLHLMLYQWKEFEPFPPFF